MKKTLLLAAIMLVAAITFARDINQDPGQFSSPLTTNGYGVAKPLPVFYGNSTVSAVLIPDAEGGKWDTGNAAASWLFGTYNQADLPSPTIDGLNANQPGFRSTYPTYSNNFPLLSVSTDNLIDYDGAGTGDLDAAFRVVYDGAKVYFFISVTDDETTGSDSVEIFFNPDNSIPATFPGWPPYEAGEDCFQLVFTPTIVDGAVVAGAAAIGGNDDQDEDDDGIVDWWVPPTGKTTYMQNILDNVDAYFQPTGNGYNLEVAVPFGVMGDGDQYPYPNGIMGCEVDVNDEDELGTAGKEAQIWWTATTNSYNRPDNWGTLFFYSSTDVSLTMPADEPVVDGTEGVGEWDAAVAHDMAFMDSTANWSGASDFAVTWKALWSPFGLYVAVNLTDEFTTAVAPNGSDNDSIEFFLDVLHQQKDCFNWSDPTAWWEVWSNVDAMNIGDQMRSGYTLGADWATSNDQNAQSSVAGGWFVEKYISFLDRNAFGSPNALLGWDLAANDRDSGATRQTMLRWYEHANESWRDASVYGTLRLVTGETGVTEWKSLE